MTKKVAIHRAGCPRGSHYGRSVPPCVEPTTRAVVPPTRPRWGTCTVARAAGAVEESLPELAESVKNFSVTAQPKCNVRGRRWTHAHQLGSVGSSSGNDGADGEGAGPKPRPQSDSYSMCLSIDSLEVDRDVRGSAERDLLQALGSLQRCGLDALLGLQLQLRLAHAGRGSSGGRRRSRDGRYRRRVHGTPSSCQLHPGGRRPR